MASADDTARNPVIFLDIAIGKRSAGRIQIELDATRVPRAAENFRQLCTGEYRRGGIPVGYKGASFHRLIAGFMIQGGDFVRGDGTGTTSIYGDHFDDEPDMGQHAVGVLSMANSGPHTNGCQFFITCAPCSFLDGKHVVVGRVIEGMNVVRMIEEVPTVGSKPRVPVIIEQCGEM